MFLLRWLFRLIDLGVFLAIGLALAAAGASVLYFMPGDLAQDKTIVIERGGVAQIAATLEREGVFSPAQSYVFRAGVLATGQRGQLKAGEYAFSAQISPAAVVALLSSGKVVIHKLTVVEGTTVREILALLRAEPVLTGDLSGIPPEGTLLPETYFFNRGDTRAEVLARMQEAGRKALQEAWAKRAPNLPYTTMQQALVLASIVEKETGVAGERPRVAGVFVNRLRKGMKLQSDPTAIYPLSQFTGNLGRALTRKDLETPSPYNTYYADGLPPGPIANPGLAALQAVMNPEKHDYIYFVADGSGGHAFAASLDEHNRNVAKWRALQGR